MDFMGNLVYEDAPIKETLSRIDHSPLKIGLVVNRRKRLIGIITDGDVRRGILRGKDLNAANSEFMNENFCALHQGESESSVVEQATSLNIHVIPVLDASGCVTRVIDLSARKESLDSRAFVMVGGLGSRLRPLTDKTPKPMLDIGGKPLLATITENFRKHGITRLTFCLKYLGNQIVDYFGDGLANGVSIDYIYEQESLGTAGALGLVRDELREPFVVMNGDVLTTVNFRHLIEFHTNNAAAATMCVSEYNAQIPYGVIRIKHDSIAAIEEKPSETVFINAGVYILSPECLECIPQKQYLDMTTLFQMLIEKGKVVKSFPLREYWLDIGRYEDYNRAKSLYQEIFDDRK